MILIWSHPKSGEEPRKGFNTCRMVLVTQNYNSTIFPTKTGKQPVIKMTQICCLFKIVQKFLFRYSWCLKNWCKCRPIKFLVKWNGDIQLHGGQLLFFRTWLPLWRTKENPAQASTRIISFPEIIGRCFKRRPLWRELPHQEQYLHRVRDRVRLPL